MNTEEIIQLDKLYYMNTFGNRTHAIVPESGRGSTIYDKDGKAYIDFLAGIAVNVLGYGHPVLTQAVINQVQKMMHCSNNFYIESQSLLAQLLVQNSCGDRVFFANSGAEANEGAIKLARKYFYKKNANKYEIITTNNSFHGRTMATLAATGQEKYQKPFKPMPQGFKSVAFNDLKAARDAVSDTTCAIMIELIQGEGGVIEAHPDYVTGLKNLCMEKGLLLIFDEVQTGIGRTGKMFAYEHYGVEPDIFTLAKGLGGGIPIGAVVAKNAVASAFEPGDHGTTFGGNPLACSAGAAVISTLIKDNLIQSSMSKGTYFKNKLSSLSKNYPFIRDVRGKGLMLGLELDCSIPGKSITKACQDKGFIINCAGNNTLRFVPPLVIELFEIDLLVQALDDIFSSY